MVEIVLQGGVVDPLGESVAILAEIEVGAFDEFDRELLIVADQAQRFLRGADASS